MTTTQSTGAKSGRAMRWGGYILTGLFAAFMAFDIVIKLIGLPIVAQTLADLGYPPGLGLAIGVMELILLLLYLFPRTAVFGAILLTALFGGTAATHLRAGSPLFSHILFGVYLAVIAWGGLYLRDAGLRRMIPWRR